MTTIAAGTTQNFSVTTRGQTLTVVKNSGSIVNVSGAATARMSESPGRRTFGPFEVDDSITVEVSLGDVIVEFGGTQAKQPTPPASLRYGNAFSQLLEKPRLLTVMATPPTVAMGTAGAASTIASAVQVPVARRNATLAEVDRDPSFLSVSAPQGALLMDAVSRVRGNLLTNGGTFAARWGTRWRFVWYGTAFDFYLRALSTAIVYRILVDGQPVAEDFTTFVSVANNSYHLLVTFGSAGRHEIELDLVDTDFGGVFIEPTGSVERSRQKKPTLAVLSNSICGGANGVTRHETWPCRAAEALGMDWVNLSIGGTGYETTVATYISRVPDAVLANADVLVLGDPYNDLAAQTTAQIAADAQALITAVRASGIKSKLMQLGPWSPSQTLPANGAAAEMALRAVADANGIPFLSYIDPLRLTDVVPAWTNGTVYAVGDTVASGGIAWSCIVAHTGSGALNTTNFKALSLITGTGHVGATTGDGNADILISSDGTHPVIAGHKFMGLHMATQIYRALAPF